MDFTGSVAQAHRDIEARSVYDFMCAKMEVLLSEAAVEWIELYEVMYVGGSLRRLSWVRPMGGERG